MREPRSRRTVLRFHFVSLLFAMALAAGASSCQERREPTVSLTQEQWKRVKPYVSDSAPQTPPAIAVGATFGKGGKPLVELVGYTLEPRALVTGKPFTVTWLWRAIEKPDRNWKIFVHLQPKNGGAFQNLDHHPVENLYQTSSWERGQYIQDVQKATLQAGFPSAGGTLSVGFWDERGGERLEILDAGRGTVVEDGKLQVGEVGTENDKQLVIYKVAEAPVLDGVLNDPAWRTAERTAPFVAPTDGKSVDFTTTVRAVYTDDAIYFAFEARDRDLRTRWTQRDDRLWEQDCVEIYLNPDNDEGTYWELQISPGEGVDGTVPIFDAYFEKRRQPAWEIAKNANIEGMEVGLRRQGTLNSDTRRADDTQYTLEIKIPFAELTTGARGALERIRLDPIPPTPGSTWRVNFFRVDHTDTGSGSATTRHAAWSPSGGDFHNLDAFGVLEFGGERPTRADGGSTPPEATAAEPGGGRTVAASARATILRTAYVEAGTLSRASTASRGALQTCFESAARPPTARVELDFEVSVGVDGTIAGISRTSNEASVDDAIYRCVEEVVGGWSGIQLRAPAPTEPGAEEAPWDPASVAGEIGFAARIIYTPERTLP